MTNLIADVPASLKAAVDAEAMRTRASSSSIVTAALSQYLGISLHTLFQVSTTSALVTGVDSGAITVGSLLRHGDFGLGTFEQLDGEMIVLDGHVYRARGNGEVLEADRERWKDNMKGDRKSEL